MPEATAPFRFEYAREPDVSPRLDRELRELISGCFDQPEQAFFRERRYAQEMPRHRFMLRGESGPLLAHLAAHEKLIGVGAAELKVGGLAEACVRHSERGQGHLRRLLTRAHEQLAVYASSGYRPLEVSVRRFAPKTRTVEDGKLAVALYRALTDEPWPAGPVDLRGPLF